LRGQGTAAAPAILRIAPVSNHGRPFGGEGAAHIDVPWWIHPILAATVVTLTPLAVYFGRKSAKAPTDSYQPILRKHLMCAIPAVSFACVAVVLGPIAMDEAGLDALETPHAIIGLTAVSSWIVQACLGWLLWSDKEKARKIHRYNGYFVLSLAMLQVPVGILIFLEFRKYYP
jgi:hypothetical protein